MKDFFKFTLATIVGILVTGAVIVGFGIISLIGIWATSETETVVKNNSIYVLEFKGVVSERSQENPFGQLFGDNTTVNGLDDIIEFSELEEYIDNPVRTYSSGMYMRLAFAVAINVNADILLIDEILAVGDANFQAKCFDKLKEIKERGTTIIIVSHALGQIEQICDRTIWLQDGQIKLSGTPRDVHPKYQNYMNEMRKKMANENMDEFVPPEPEETEDEKRYGDKRVVITEVEMQNAEGKKQRAFTCGEPITIQVQFHVNEPVEKAMMGFGIFRRDGMHCYGCNTHIDNIGDLSFKEDGTVRIRLEEMDLLEGSYSLDLAIQTDLEEPIDFYREVMPFELYNSKSDIGVVRIPHSWELEEVQKE